MKMRVFGSGLCLALLISVGACSKSSESDKLPPMQIQGVNVDLPQLAVLFAKGPPELQQKVSEALTKARYNRYVPAMMDLDAVASSPGLTEQQKKLVNQVVAQLKEVTAKDPGYQ